LVGIVAEMLAPVSCSVVGRGVDRVVESASSKSFLFRFRIVLFETVAACSLTIA
jgi:hypothetical protein